MLWPLPSHCFYSVCSACHHDDDGSQVQTNVFTGGKENPVFIDVGVDTSATDHDYVIEWDDQQVQFFVDGQSVRTQALDRPLKPLQLSASVWTTANGWEGLKTWVRHMWEPFVGTLI